MLQASNVVELLRKLKAVVAKANMDYMNGKLTLRYNDGIHDYVIEVTCKTPESCKLIEDILRYIDFIKHLPF